MISLVSQPTESTLSTTLSFLIITNNFSPITCSYQQISQLLAQDSRQTMIDKKQRSTRYQTYMRHKKLRLTRTEKTFKSYKMRIRSCVRFLDSYSQTTWRPNKDKKQRIRSFKQSCQEFKTRLPVSLRSSNDHIFYLSPKYF